MAQARAGDSTGRQMIGARMGSRGEGPRSLGFGPGFLAGFETGFGLESSLEFRLQSGPDTCLGLSECGHKLPDVLCAAPGPSPARVTDPSGISQEP